MVSSTMEDNLVAQLHRKIVCLNCGATSRFADPQCLFLARRQSEAVDVAPDEHNLGVVVQQEVVTPSTIRVASARLGSLQFEDV